MKNYYPASLSYHPISPSFSKIPTSGAAFVPHRLVPPWSGDNTDKISFHPEHPRSQQSDLPDLEFENNCSELNFFNKVVQKRAIASYETSIDHGKVQSIPFEDYNACQ